MIQHRETPPFVKAIYVSLGTAIHPERLDRLTTQVEGTELNALFVDIRSTGGPLLRKTDAETAAVLQDLHDRGLYVAARLVAFQGGPRGWYDPGSEDRWKRIAEVSHRAVDLGFDEINFDYFRYGASREPKSPTPVPERAGIIRSFAEFLREEVGEQTGRPLSVDIFGYTLLGPQLVIGQRLEDFAELSDYVMPMPYPSHWGLGTFGIKNPAHEPYKVVHRALSEGWKQVAGDPKRRAQLRTWIQAFNLDSAMRFYPYTPWHVREQIRACVDAGGAGWCAWNAKNEYDPRAFSTE
ncbi:MAG: putative glycoside hydrolase [Minicystis sp.]